METDKTIDRWRCRIWLPVPVIQLLEKAAGTRRMSRNERLGRVLGLGAREIANRPDYVPYDAREIARLGHLELYKISLTVGHLADIMRIERRFGGRGKRGRAVLESILVGLQEPKIEDEKGRMVPMYNLGLKSGSVRQLSDKERENELNGVPNHWPFMDDDQPVSVEKRQIE